MAREGMSAVTVETDAFSGGPGDRVFLGSMLALMYHLNLDRLRRSPAVPPIYQSGVIYKEEPPGVERWKIAPIIVQDGYGDCEDLASWRAAELTLSGINSLPFFRERQIPMPDGRTLRMFHILVARNDGYIEDPSYILGMRTPFGDRPAGSSPAIWFDPKRRLR